MKICNRLLQICNCIILLTTLFFLVYRWNKIPNQIPTHYNVYGIIDHYGDKNNLIGIFVIEVIIYFVVSIIGFILDKFVNYDDNMKKNYKKYVSTTSSLISLVSNITFSILIFKISNSSNISPWITFAPLIIVFIIFCFIFYKVNAE